MERKFQEITNSPGIFIFIHTLIAGGKGHVGNYFPLRKNITVQKKLKTNKGRYLCDTSRTLLKRSCGNAGFDMNSNPFLIIPFRDIRSSLYPLVKRVKLLT